ncbi:transporter, major facilitator family (plasmid) [Granulicella tundricola MP5ACTX9]|uniref:Transporter, major facilitator family n=2 Tax=Granulicella TaxID=940557 RepID=E8X6V5_GRATM|nr:transporter, major facilitator family [Granulicella tundricola MP5ACTX9]
MQGVAKSKTFPWGALPLYLGFFGTGIGVALPGALLPALQMRWHLQDEQSGRLFLMAWIGSSLGALLVRRSLRTTLVFGSLGVAVGAAGLALSGGHGVNALMALYGMGLGATMTSVSLIRQQQTVGSGTEMVRLNLVWAIGACACPSLTVHALGAGDFGPVLLGLAGCFLALAGAALAQRELMVLTAGAEVGDAWAIFRRMPLGLIAMIFLVTGIEASAGGWLTTYTRRGGHELAEAVAAPTCLWAGLLLSRLFWSVRDKWLSEAVVVRGSLVLMTAAAVLLVATTHGVAILAAAFLLGFGIGPTYPLLLGWALRYQRGGAIFFVAGVGSACLPWMTGLVSAERGSLRMGLVVPMVGTAVMLLVAMVSPVRSWGGAVPVKTRFGTPLGDNPG